MLLLKRWSSKKADWMGFSNGCTQHFTEDLIESSDVDGTCSCLTDALIREADAHIPVSQKGWKHQGVRYWNDACDDTVNEYSQTHRRFERSRLIKDRVLYNVANARSRCTILDTQEIPLGSLS